MDFLNKFYLTLPFYKTWLIVSITTIVGFLIIDFIFNLNLIFIIGILLSFFTLLIILRIVQLIYHRIEEKKHDYSQIEALFSLYHTLSPEVQLPKMRNFAGSPDFINLIIELLEKTKPSVIVEASSGVSSIIISEWLLKYSPQTIHIALDHEEKYAQLTRNKIRNPNSKIIHAPITNYKINGQMWKWYQMDALKGIDKVDLVIVDGPPGTLQELSRYPAGPLLLPKLSDKAHIIMDDGKRKNETIIVEKWVQELGLISESRDLEKGAFILSNVC